MTAKISHYKEELNRTIEWLKFAEQKFTLLSVYYGTGITFLVTINEKLINLYSNPVFAFYYFFKGLLGFAFLVSLLMGIYFLLKVTFPKLNNEGKNKSLFYFGDVANMKISEYIKEMEDISDTDIEGQLLKQIHINAKITNEKMINIKCSSICLFINVTLLIVMILIL